MYTLQVQLWLRGTSCSYCHSESRASTNAATGEEEHDATAFWRDCSPCVCGERDECAPRSVALGETLVCIDELCWRAGGRAVDSVYSLFLPLDMRYFSYSWQF